MLDWLSVVLEPDLRWQMYGPFGIKTVVVRSRGLWKDKVYILSSESDKPIYTRWYKHGESEQAYEELIAEVKK